MVPNETTITSGVKQRTADLKLVWGGEEFWPSLYFSTSLATRWKIALRTRWNSSQEQVRNCSQVINTPLMQVISSSPPIPALASLRVVPRGGGRVVSGCKGTSGQVCAPPGGSCSPGFSCRVGYELIPRTLALGMRGSLQRQMSVWDSLLQVERARLGWVVRARQMRGASTFNRSFTWIISALQMMSIEHTHKRLETRRTLIVTHFVRTDCIWSDQGHYVIYDKCCIELFVCSARCKSLYLLRELHWELNSQMPCAW